MGFTASKASDILSSIFSGTYVGLHVGSTAPSNDGNGFVEPSPATGYERSSIGKLNTSIKSQVANDKIIFFNESIGAGYGTATHFGVFNSDAGGTPFFIGELRDADTGVIKSMTIGAGYVPIFRAEQLIIALDKAAVEYYG